MSTSERPRLLAKVLRLTTRLKPGRWPSDLGEPINPLDNTIIATAHSLLHGFVRDASGLTPNQARDVVSWASQGAMK